MNSLSRIIGLRVRQARERIGLNQEELGKRLASLSGESRFSTTMISLLEAGNRPIKIEDISLFANVLDVNPSFFLEDTDLLAPSTSDVKQVFLRAAKYLHPQARTQLEMFIDDVENLPPSPTPVVRTTPTIRALELIRSAGYSAPYIDPKDIAHKIGLKVIEIEFDEDISGVLVLSGSHRVIGVNKRQLPQRQRFSIAHEIAHFVKRHQTTIDIDMTNQDWAIENGSNPIEERQANAFAAELLMPLEWIEKDYRSYNADYEKLAHHYGVSKQAMWFRLVEAGLVTD